MQLVLRVLDWYTSCSSLNLPSAEYTGQNQQSYLSVHPSLAGSLFSSSLIDAGMRSGIGMSQRRPFERHHLSHQQIRVKLRLCVWSRHLTEPERPLPMTCQTLRKAGGEQPSSPH